MANSIQWLYFEKGSPRWRLSEVLGCACIFSTGHPSNYIRRRDLHWWKKTAFREAITICV